MGSAFNEGVRLRDAVLSVGDAFPELGRQEQLLSEAKRLLDDGSRESVAEAQLLINEARALNDRLRRRSAS